MKKCCVLLFIMAFLLAGCHNVSAEYPGTIAAEETLISETIYETSPTVPTSEPPLAFHTYADMIAYYRTCQDHPAYQWMVNLKAEDVDYIEYVNLDDLLTPYRKYGGEKIQDVVDLFQKNACIEYVDTVSWPGYFAQEFHIIMKDGTAHTVCSIESDITVIDGVAFRSDMNWISKRWPYSGDAPLPEDWEVTVSERSYCTFDEEASLLVTGKYVHDREMLDQQYDTSITMGADSRIYPIGRGSVTLSAIEPSSTFLTVNAYWTGSHQNSKLCVKPEFWLEAWNHDETHGYGTYSAIESEPIMIDYTPTNTGEKSIRWGVQWEETVGILAPGHYRVGMVLYEDADGVCQNETVCYAKFSVE